MSSREGRAGREGRLDETARQAVIEHMNADHADALLLYAEVFGGIEQPRRAVMTDIDRRGLSMNVESDGEARAVRIEFDAPLTGRASARNTLVDMVKRARLRLAGKGSTARAGHIEEKSNV